MHGTSAVFAHKEEKIAHPICNKMQIFLRKLQLNVTFFEKLQPNAEKIAESAILRWGGMCSFARGLCYIEGRDGAALITFPFGEGGLRSKTDEVEICYYNQI